ncbi:hypothetical protein F8388_004911 [Cannabis sativa]|uniref:Reverse transcriptase zinc-binding domain-containing protein n=1 Tax=Cannabis sativa TaxID=3483 RepID=A0A7J6HNY0_CANSA|nr:hypothetical protein F8388_004911 [Cannabis sativa]
MNLHPTRCSNMGEINKWWKMLWSLQLPPMMKLFGWRVCHNWLPTKTNLCHRGMNISPVCDLCGSHVETLPHALWNCDKVKTVWKLLPWYKHCGKLGDGSMFDLLTALKEKLTRSEFEDSLKIMWAIWENRNRKWNKLPVMNGAQSGNVLTAGMVYIPSSCSVTVAEAWAILEALKGRLSTDTRPFEI